MSSEPVLVNVGKGWRLDLPGRRRYFHAAGITSVRIKAMMSKGMDTAQIAEAFETTESGIWNALARAGA